MNIEEVYKIIFDTLKQIIGVKSASILLKGEKGGRLKKAASMGRVAPQVIKKYLLKLEKRAIGEIQIHLLLPQKKVITRDDDELLNILVEQAAVAITGAGLYTASSQGIVALDKSLKKAEPTTKKKLTKAVAEDISLSYIQLLRAYLDTKKLDKEESLVEDLSEKLIEYGITPKGIIDVHLKAVPQLATMGSLETNRITFEVRMVLLAVMTKYASLLRRKIN